MRGLLLAAAGLLLATAAVQAQPAQLAATKPDVHQHAATSLFYRSDAEARMEPIVTRPLMPAVCKLPAYPSSLGYAASKRAYRPHIEYIERTYVVVEDSIPEGPAQAVSSPPPRSRKK
ncbi:hypothetical protein HHL22_10640 [Hymenobacter sp. RP-2-7]|uniref:Uncharacterized protein n=1 Tax=Hymenobacter polaris TaxID=2682546 RepID=A0A7Y0AE59_9BACT|nr:hypothetical protein [Hymenobacter polaris]NML65662.1 hypothetical protein [Hymenobacter polaris]